MDDAAVVGREAEHTGSHRGDRARDPDHRSRRGDVDTQGVEGRVDVLGRRLDLRCGGRVAGQVPLGQPDRADVERLGGADTPAAEPRMNSVDPPPMSSTRYGLGRLERERPRGAGVGEARLGVAAEHLGVDADPLAHAGHELLGVLGVAGRRRRAEADGCSTSCSPTSLGVLVEGREHALQRCLGEPPGAVDALAEPDDLHRPDQLDGLTGPGSRSAMSSRSELVPQSKAATRVMTGLRCPGERHAWPRGPELAERVEHLVAQRVHAPALGQRLAGEDVQALHPVGHPARGDAGDLGDVASGLRGDLARERRGSARGQRGTQRPGARRRAAAGTSPSSAPTPRGCRSSRRPGDR